MEGALREKIQDDLKVGKGAEALFIKAITREGYYYLTSSTKDDALEHWDLRLIKSPLDLYVDVKKEKDATIEKDMTWLEKKNVDGNVGWLFAPKLQAVAFQRKGKFHIIPIEALRNLYEEKVLDKSALVFDKPTEPYIQYSRVKWGRQDVAVLAPFSDILPHEIMVFDIEKNEEISNI
jgi:hypothetical protein